MSFVHSQVSYFDALHKLYIIIRDKMDRITRQFYHVYFRS